MKHAPLVAPLWTPPEIAARVHELGLAIAHDYHGRSLRCVCVLQGASVFFADLVRAIDLPLTFDFVTASSYGDATTSSGIVHVSKGFAHDTEHHDVLIIEDIVDTGLTVHRLHAEAIRLGAASVRVCALLDKRAARRVPVEVDYVGFVCPEKFVVGYGMDAAGMHRNLPFIGELTT